MKKSHLTAAVLLLFYLALVLSSVQASQSATYRLDWFTPLTSGGGAPSSSTHYSADLTVGQTVSKASSGPGYQASLGYWAGISPAIRLNLPVVLR